MTSINHHINESVKHRVKIGKKAMSRNVLLLLPLMISDFVTVSLFIIQISSSVLSYLILESYNIKKNSDLWYTRISTGNIWLVEYIPFLSGLFIVAKYAGVGVDDFIEMCYRGLLRVSDNRPDLQNQYLQWYNEWRDHLQGTYFLLNCELFKLIHEKIVQNIRLAC